MVQHLKQELKFETESIFFLFDNPTKDASTVTGKSTKRDLMKVVDQLVLTVKPKDLLFILLLGHGNFDGEDYRYNLVGKAPASPRPLSLRDPQGEG